MHLCSSRQTDPERESVTPGSGCPKSDLGLGIDGMPDSLLLGCTQKRGLFLSFLSLHAGQYAFLGLLFFDGMLMMAAD